MFYWSAAQRLSLALVVISLLWLMGWWATYVPQVVVP